MAGNLVMVAGKQAMVAGNLATAAGKQVMAREIRQWRRRKKQRYLDKLDLNARGTRAIYQVLLTPENSSLTHRAAIFISALFEIPA